MSHVSSMRSDLLKQALAADIEAAHKVCRRLIMLLDQACKMPIAKPACNCYCLFLMTSCAKTIRCADSFSITVGGLNSNLHPVLSRMPVASNHSCCLTEGCKYLLVFLLVPIHACMYILLPCFCLAGKSGGKHGEICTEPGKSGNSQSQQQTALHYSSRPCY